jgi:type III pantothenate kinase
MSWLLIDNSNTRTKFALGEASGSLEPAAVLATHELSPRSLNAALAGYEWDGVVLCSVVPATRDVLTAWLAPRSPLHLLDAKSPLGCRVDYPEPSQIGADRLANAVAVVSQGKAPAIVIDFGTAVTFDVLSCDLAYCGGVIAPGLGAMSGYLSARTALLPQIELHEPRAAIGKSTVEAMQAGAVYGYRGLVREILSRLIAEMGGRPLVIATGGDAELIARGVAEIDEVDPLITLEGIRQVAVRVFGANEIP